MTPEAAMTEQRPPLPDDEHIAPPPEPASDLYADEDDALDWDVTKQGRMREHADDSAPATEPWQG